MSLKSLNARLAKIPEPDLERYKAQERCDALKELSPEVWLALRNVLRRDSETDLKLTPAELDGAVNAELVALGMPPKPIDRVFATDSEKKNGQRTGDKPAALKTPPPSKRIAGNKASTAKSKSASKPKGTKK